MEYNSIVGWGDMKNKFGERLRELRRDKGLSQKELGIKFGFSQTGIAKWEKGIREPNLDDLIMIADFFVFRQII